MHTTLPVNSDIFKKEANAVSRTSPLSYHCRISITPLQVIVTLFLLTDQNHFPVGDPTTRTDDATLGGSVGPPGRDAFLLVLGRCEVYQGQETWSVEMRFGEREEELRGGELGYLKQRGGKRRHHLLVLSNVNGGVVIMSAKIYYDSDADLCLLTGKTIVFLGFGNQGAAQAQNLRDSGIPNEQILIANREDSYAEDAKSKGFHVEHDFPSAAKVADIIFLLIPDQVQPRVFNEQIVPTLKENATIVIASGYNVFYKLLNFKSTQDVVMVAPRMIGSSVRSLYQKGKGFPCFVSVEQDGTGSGLKYALALSKAIGATKAGAIASSAREETAMDLFAEQALWPNIIMLFREAFSVLKEAGCSDEALCYEMWMSKEPAEIFERAAEDGFVAQLKHHSTVSQYGQLNGSLSLDGTSIRSHFKDILHNQVLNGKFCKEFSKIEADLEKEGDANPLNELYKRSEQSELAQAEKRVRQRLANLL